MLVSGLLLGGVYALLAIGLSLVLGVTDFINFAHGDFIIIGSYTAFMAYSLVNLIPYFSVPLIILGGLLFGGIIYFIVKNKIGKEPQSQMLMTLGFSIMIQNALLMIFSSNYKGVPSKFGGAMNIGDVYFSRELFITFSIAIFLTLMLFLFMNFTSLGKAMKAVAEDRAASKLMGINVQRIDFLVFSLGTILAFVGGGLLLTIYPVTPTMGTRFNLLAWIMVIFGGVGNFFGTFVAALFIAVTETVTGFYLGADMRQIGYFLLFVVALVFFPKGLFNKFSLQGVMKLWRS